MHVHFVSSQVPLTGCTAMQKEAARLSIVEESRTLINKTLNAFVSTVSQVKPNILIVFTIKAGFFMFYSQ